jgi:hypothetical protein
MLIALFVGSVAAFMASIVGLLMLYTQEPGGDPGGPSA